MKQFSKYTATLEVEMFSIRGGSALSSTESKTFLGYVVLKMGLEKVV